MNTADRNVIKVNTQESEGSRRINVSIATLISMVMWEDQWNHFIGVSSFVIPMSVSILSLYAE
jgi:hypothetical protein